MRESGGRALHQSRPSRYDPDGGAGKERSIFTALDNTIDTYDAGAMPGHGTFACTECGTQLSLEGSDVLTVCPRCENGSFRRDSMFEEMQEHEAASTSEFAAPTPLGSPEGLERARAKLPGPGKYLVCCEGKEEIEAFRIEPGWTRIGRSVNADIRLDDPSVSRRHALIVCEDPDAMRVLDDRSLNGIYLNGELVEWGRLKDGDELTIGRFRLFALEA
jgi:hypothetical protein